jgi:hypothetical protein
MDRARKRGASLRGSLSLEILSPSEFFRVQDQVSKLGETHSIAYMSFDRAWLRHHSIDSGVSKEQQESVKNSKLPSISHSFCAGSASQRLAASSGRANVKNRITLIAPLR